jgi:hypothetical protein
VNLRGDCATAVEVSKVLTSYCGGGGYIENFGSRVSGWEKRRTKRCFNLLLPRYESRFQGLGLSVQGLGFRVQGLGFMGGGRTKRFLLSFSGALSLNLSPALLKGKA